MPVAHMFTKRAQPWVQPAADTECYETQPLDFNTLMSTWRAMWPEFFPQK